MGTFASAQERLVDFYHQALLATFEKTSFPSKNSYTFVNKVAEEFIPLQQKRNHYLNNFNYEKLDIAESNLFTNLNKTYNIELISISYWSNKKNIKSIQILSMLKVLKRCLQTKIQIKIFSLLK